MACTFCQIIAGNSPAQFVHETEHAVAFMDLLPMTDGHALIVPKAHVVDLLDIDDVTLAHTMSAARELAAVINETLQPLGLNLLHNSGAAADQSQFHFHAHLIPRYGRDRLLHPMERRFGDPVRLREVADLIRTGHDDDIRTHLEGRSGYR